MKIQFTHSKRHRRFNLRGISWFLSLALAIFAAPLTVSAQAQGVMTLTLMPIEVRQDGPDCKPLTIDAAADHQPKCKVVLRFQTSSLPPGATFTAADLMLVGQMRVKQTIRVTVNSDDGPVFAEITGASRQAFPANKRAHWLGEQAFLDKMNAPNATPFSLVLKTTSRGQGSTWENSIDKSGSRPRLIIEYTVSNRPAVVLTEGVPATHSATSFLPNPIVANQFTARDVSSIGSYTPVFYKGLVQLIRENQLQALPALGGPPVWSLPVTGAGQHLLLSETNRLYIVGSDKILVYQLQVDPGKPASEITTSGGQPLSPKSVTNLNPSLGPAVGPDGSLYFINGQEVYGLNADLQELWKVTLEDLKTSRITVGPTSQFVYLAGKKGGAMSLIAIDAQTGEVSAANLPNSDDLMKADKPTLHAPVVLLHQDGTEKIYVAANSVTNGALAAFDNLRTTVAGREKQVAATEGWNVLTGLVSQPTAVVGDTRKIYSVQVTGTQGQLKALDWLTGSAVSVGDPFPVGASDLLNGGNLAVDRGGNVVVWSGASGADAKLYVFGAGASGLSPTPLAVLASRSRLLFGSDGTLYTTDPTNTSGTLRAIVPQYTLVNSSSGTISSPTHLRVDGIVDKNTELTAPGSVVLREGFTVKQGVTLTVKQPKP